MRRQRLRTTIAIAALSCCAVVGSVTAQTPNVAEPQQTQAQKDADALNAEASRLYKAGKYAEGVPLAQRALSLRERALGPEHPDVGQSLNALAALYAAQYHTVEAEPLYKRALAISEKALGLEHPDVGRLLNNLAALYHFQGRYAEAEPLYRRSLAVWQKVLGADHPDVATSLNNLAALYDDQGRYAESEPLYRRGLAIREKALGPEHPDVATLLNNLAELYRAQGRTGKAEPLLKRSLALRETALGPDHPDVATSLSNLAALYMEQGHTAATEPLLKRSLALRETTLGPDHPDVAASLNNLAALYEAQGRLAEAEPLHKRSFAIKEKALGPDHPLVANSLSNLAALYVAQGRTTEAEPLMKRALTVGEKALGREHPLVANSLSNLAVLYLAQGRAAEAEPLHKRSLAIKEKALGPDHHAVATSLNNLAWLALARHDMAAAAVYWRASTAVLQRRAERGLGGAPGGSAKGEAQRRSGYFKGLIKSTQRLPTTGHEELARRAKEMFETAQWGQGSEAAASLAQMAARSAKGSPALAAIVRERQDLVAEWQGKDKLLIAAKSEPPAKRKPEAEAAFASRLAAIDGRLAEIDIRLAEDFPDYAALASPKPISVADVQADLRDDEALVLFLDTSAGFKPLPEETFVWVVTKREMRWERADAGTQALTEYVAALRCGLDASAWWVEDGARCRNILRLDKSPGDNEPLPFSAGIAHELYEALFGQVRDLIKDKHLLIVPSGPLTKLPLHVLVTQEPEAGSDFRLVAWIARENAVTVLPAVSTLKALRRVAKPSAATLPMIGFGNPLLDGDQRDPTFGSWYKEKAAAARAETGCAATAKLRTARLRFARRGVDSVRQSNGLADLDHIRVQAPLPETADELCAVARDLGTDLGAIHIGARATESEVKSLSETGELAKYRVVQFATHGTLAGELKGTSEPGLLMTPPKTATLEDDGFLSGSEIASLKLDADWVILSACNTAGGEGSGEAAEALSGLARVFFYAGARALLVSHWAVDSAATVKLVTGAIAELAKDKAIGRAEAMRRAMLAVMVDTSRPANWDAAWHPSVWAPFVVVGEGAPAK